MTNMNNQLDGTNQVKLVKEICASLRGQKTVNQ